MKTLAELVANPESREEELSIWGMIYWRYPEIAAVVYTDARRRGELELLPDLEKIVAESEQRKPYYRGK